MSIIDCLFMCVLFLSTSSLSQCKPMMIV